jgi:hypothetical protein
MSIEFGYRETRLTGRCEAFEQSEQFGTKPVSARRCKSMEMQKWRHDR